MEKIDLTMIEKLCNELRGTECNIRGEVATIIFAENDSMLEEFSNGGLIFTKKISQLQDISLALKGAKTILKNAAHEDEKAFYESVITRLTILAACL